MKTIVGIWKADPCKYRKDFTIWYHFLMPDVLPF